MENKRIPFEQLPITDRFMFAMVFSHKEIAKPFLEAVLGIKIHELRDPEPEKTIEVNPISKGVRFDVFVKETGPSGGLSAVSTLKCRWKTPRRFPNGLASTRPCVTARL